MTRTWIPVVVVVAALAGCTSSRAPDAEAPGPGPGTSTPSAVPAPAPLLPLPAQIASATIAVRTGQGLYLVDPPFPGEASVRGNVQVMIDGTTPPAGTTVTLNGVPLVARTDLPGLSRRFWSVDPAGPQPVVGGDGALTLVVQGGGSLLQLSLPCPADPGFTTSPPAGTSLGGASALALGWTYLLPANAANVLPSDLYPVARLRGRDLATGTASMDLLSQVRVEAGASGVSLDVGTAGSGGYLAEVSVPGPQTVLGTSAGFCGRLRRITYAP